MYNKLDELEALVSTKQLENCCCLAITETWLDASHSDKFISLPGYSTVRADRDTNKANKQCGGGLLLYINDNWANNFILVSTHIEPHLEIMVVKVRPFWLPREIACVLLILVYCPVFDKPSHANVKDVVAKLHNTIEKYEQDNPNAAIITLGDFNSASIKLRRYKQYVSCTTRQNKTLDKLYALHSYRYKSYKQPQLGNSDHHSVLLLPYNHRLTDHRTKPRKITKQLWSDDNIKTLQSCLDDTDWSVFLQNPSVSVQTEEITDYLLYCIQQNIPSKTVNQHHDKPWMNGKIRRLLSQRHEALTDQDDVTYQATQQQIQREIRYAKQLMGRQVDEKFQSDTKSAWNMLKSLLKLKDKHVECSVDVDMLNRFFARFESDMYHPFYLM